MSLVSSKNIFDVAALSPSLDQRQSAQIVAEAVMESDVRYARVDLDIAGVHLATVWSKDRLKKEGFYALMPRKKSSRGRI